MAGGASRATTQRRVGASPSFPVRATGCSPRRHGAYGSEDPGIKAPPAPFFGWSYGEAMAIGDFNGDRTAWIWPSATAGRVPKPDSNDYDEPVSCPGESSSALERS